MQPKQSKSADVNFGQIAFLYGVGLNQSEIAKYLHISKTTVNTALKQKNLAWKINNLTHHAEFLTYINESL